jgi:hypothetical protein
MASPSDSLELSRRKNIQDRIDATVALFKKEGFELSLKGNSLETGEPSRGGFPVEIFTLSVFKDIFDGLELTLVFIIVTKILSAILAVILFLWTSIHFSGRFWEHSAKKERSKIRYRLLLACLIEMVPFLGMLPADSFFVWWARMREKKIIHLFDQVKRSVS